MRPFWFLYAFSQPITGHLKGLCSSPNINAAWGIPFIAKICCCRYARIISSLLPNWACPNANWADCCCCSRCCVKPFGLYRRLAGSSMHRSRDRLSGPMPKG